MAVRKAPASGFLDPFGGSRELRCANVAFKFLAHNKTNVHWKTTKLVSWMSDLYGALRISLYLF